MFGNSAEKRIAREADKVASMKEDLDALSWKRVLEIGRRLQSEKTESIAQMGSELVGIAQSNISLAGRLGIGRESFEGRFMPSGMEVLEGGLVEAALDEHEKSALEEAPEGDFSGDDAASSAEAAFAHADSALAELGEVFEVDAAALDAEFEPQEPSDALVSEIEEDVVSPDPVQLEDAAVMLAEEDAAQRADENPPIETDAPVPVYADAQDLKDVEQRDCSVEEAAKPVAWPAMPRVERDAEASRDAEATELDLPIACEALKASLTCVSAKKAGALYLAVDEVEKAEDSGELEGIEESGAPLQDAVKDDSDDSDDFGGGQGPQDDIPAQAADEEAAHASSNSSESEKDSKAEPESDGKHSGGKKGKKHRRDGVSKKRFARFRNLYESRDGGLCVFEDENGHLVAVDSTKLM